MTIFRKKLPLEGSRKPNPSSLKLPSRPVSEIQFRNVFFLGLFQSSRYVPECGGYAIGEAEWVCGEDRVEIYRFPLSYKFSDRSVSFRCPGEHKRQTFRSLHSEVGTKSCIARGSCSLCLSYFLFFASHISDSLTWQSS